MRTLSINLVKIIERLFCSKEENSKEREKIVTKKSHSNTQKLYHDVYEDLTLEQQLIMMQINTRI